MKTRAAIAVAPNAPLEIREVDLEGPKAGEVLVEIMATGICHTDAYTLEGKDSEGIFPSILGHEGAGIVREIGPGVTAVAVGDHVIPLYIAECRTCPSCLSRKTNLCTAVRATQGKGVMPDGTSRFSLDGETIAHYMGCSTFSNFTVMPEIALAKVREDAPFDKICYIGCGVTTGIGAAIWTAGRRARLDRRGVRARRHRPQRHPGRAHGRRGPDRRRRRQPGQAGDGRALRNDRLHQPGRGRPGQGRPGGGRRDQGRRRLHVRLHRQYQRHAPGAGERAIAAGGRASSSESPRRATKSRPARSS